MATIIPARHGAHTLLAPSQNIRITTPSGAQVIDLWAFPLTTPATWLSTAQTRQKISSLSPKVGEALVDTRRQAILTLVEDTSPGVHDLLYPACDAWRYAEAQEQEHRSCGDNLREALASFVKSTASPPSSLVELEERIRVWGWTPEPLNLFMNVTIGEEGFQGRKRLVVEAPRAQAGNHVDLRCEVECLVIMSACPNDLLRTNGGVLGEAMYEVMD